MAEFRTAVIWGKFYPFHRGHQYLIESALARAGRVVVLVSYREGETIPQGVRAGWVREICPAAECVELPWDLPYGPEECPTAEAFYRIWKEVCVGACGGVPDAAFTSEPGYGRFVDYLGARHVVVDAGREQWPVSGTAVRAEPWRYREMLHPAVRAYFVKTVCLFGPESVGKSTLAERLAREFGTVWQPEFARDYLGERHCEYADMEVIAEGHYREREAYKRRAERVLFVDTDTVTTAIFSEHYYGRVPGRVWEIAELADNRNDLYLLLKPDVPWVADTSRDNGEPGVRWGLYERYRRALEERGWGYVVISGNWEERFERAKGAVEGVLREGK